MTIPTKFLYVNPVCPLALVVSPSISGGVTASVIDHAKSARVIQRNFTTADEAKAEILHLAEQYAVDVVHKAFAELQWKDEVEEANNA